MFLFSNIFHSTCKGFGDDQLCGRLLPMPITFKNTKLDKLVWVHSKCAHWSSEVGECSNGELKSLQGATKRANGLKCSLCQVAGATLGCSWKGCRENCHYPCAVKAGWLLEPAMMTRSRNRKGGCLSWLFVSGKGIWCPHHAPEVLKQRKAVLVKQPTENSNTVGLIDCNTNNIDRSQLKELDGESENITKKKNLINVAIKNNDMVVDIGSSKNVSIDATSHKTENRQKKKNAKTLMKVSENDVCFH